MNAELIVPVDLAMDWVLGILLLLVPISAFLMVAPIFGNAMVPARIKTALGLAIATMLHATAPVATDLPLLELIGATIWQSFAAIGLGFATLVFFQIFVVAGQFVGMQMGLGFAAMVDPGNGIQVTVWSQFFLMLATLCFLTLNGHLITLEILLAGLQLAPTLLTLDGASFAWQLALLGGWMFAGGAAIALPAVFALLVVNLAFGVMSRSAPQLNVFSLGFPFSLLFGLVLVWASLANWLPAFDARSGELWETLARLLE